MAPGVRAGRWYVLAEGRVGIPASPASPDAVAVGLDDGRVDSGSGSSTVTGGIGGTPTALRSLFVTRSLSDGAVDVDAAVCPSPAREFDHELSLNALVEGMMGLIAICFSE